MGSEMCIRDSLIGGPFEFIVDGEADNIPADAITVIDASGTNSQWVVTDDNGNILGLPPSFTVPNFDAAGVGVCIVYHLTYEDGLTGLAGGNNLSDLDGCFSLSNGISVTRISGVACDVSGGSLSGGPFEFIVDGEADNIPADGITLMDASGPNSQWLSLIHI